MERKMNKNADLTYTHCNESVAETTCHRFFYALEHTKQAWTSSILFSLQPSLDLRLMQAFDI
jgi:hypothetical protein